MGDWFALKLSYSILVPMTPYGNVFITIRYPNMYSLVGAWELDIFVATLKRRTTGSRGGTFVNFLGTALKPYKPKNNNNVGIAINLRIAPIQ